MKLTDTTITTSISTPVVIVIVSLLLATLACNLAQTESDRDNPLVIEERPSLVFLAPANENTYLAGSTVTFHAIARDLNQDIARVEFTINTPGEPVVLTRQAPPENGGYMEAVVEWQAVGNQTYLVEAVAIREDGTGSNVPVINITVRSGTTAQNPPVSESNNNPPNTTETNADNAAPTSSTTQPASPVSFDESLLTISLPGTVTAETLPVRTGPGTTYDVITELIQNNLVEVVGRTTDSAWYLIRIDSGFGWVISNQVIVNADTNALPPFTTE